MNAKLVIKDAEHEISCGVSISDAVRSLGLVPDTFIFMIDGRPVPMDVPISEGAVIKAVKVASGG